MTTDFSDSICIAYPASWPDTIKEPHCTLIFLGKISEADFTKQDILDVLDDLKLPAPGEVEITGIQLFGPKQDIPVATVFSNRLFAHRIMIDYELAGINVKSASEFEFNPHVSISYDESTDFTAIELPKTVTLDKPVLWWGDDRD